MALGPRVIPDAVGDQIAGRVPPRLRLPGDVLGLQRTVRINGERIAHLRRRQAWLAFCLDHMGDVLEEPDFVGHRPHGDPRRIEFVKLVGPPGGWLLVSVKFLDDRRQAWVNSAHPVAVECLTRRLGAGTMHQVVRGP